MTALALFLSWFSLALYWASLYTVTSLYLIPTRFAVADLCWWVTSLAAVVDRAALPLRHTARELEEESGSIRAPAVLMCSLRWVASLTAGGPSTPRSPCW